MKFYNRGNELEELNRVWKLAKKSSHLSIISGRRRVGKTELVKNFCKDKRHLYFFIGRKNISLLLEELSAIAKKEIKQFPTILKFNEWLEFLLSNIEDGTVICFDEFQNFKYIDDSIFSDFQKVFDAYKQKSRAHIIVTGSYITLINRIFSDKKEPLFGRATERYLLKPLQFSVIYKILTDFKIRCLQEKINWYAVFGGIPRFYVTSEEQGLSGNDIFSALKILLLRDFAPLRDEARGILIEEFGSENTVYFSIMEAIAIGNNEMTTIANKTGINIKSISKYLGLLVRDFGYLSYEVPVTEDKPWRSKKGRYFIKDNFFRFWFRYIYRNRSDYEIGNYKAILNKIEHDFNSFVGMEFEHICHEIIREFNPQKRLAVNFDRIGRWWMKDKEIDLVALNSKSKVILFCECKWTENINANKVLNELREKSKAVEWNKNSRKEFYAIFAKSFKNKLKEKNVMLFDMYDIEKMFGK